MEGLLIRISFIISFIYLAFSYINENLILDAVIKSIIIFILISTMFLIIQFFLLKFMVSAKLKIIEEDMIRKYSLLEQAIQKRREYRAALKEKEAKNKINKFQNNKKK